MANQNNAQQAKRNNAGSGDAWQNWGNWGNWNNWQNCASTPGWGMWGDSSKAFGRSLDYTKLRETAGRNAETATAANKVAMAGLQALTSRTVEVAQANTRQTIECFKDACNSKSAEEFQARQADLFNSLIQSCCDNLRDSAQISAKAAEEIVGLWKTRANETVSEWTN